MVSHGRFRLAGDDGLVRIRFKRRGEEHTDSPIPDGDFGLETKLKFKPVTDYQTAYLIIYRRTR